MKTYELTFRQIETIRIEAIMHEKERNDAKRKFEEDEYDIQDYIDDCFDIDQDDEITLNLIINDYEGYEEEVIRKYKLKKEYHERRNNM